MSPGLSLSFSPLSGEISLFGGHCGLFCGLLGSSQLPLLCRGHLLLLDLNTSPNPCPLPGWLGVSFFSFSVGRGIISRGFWNPLLVLALSPLSVTGSPLSVVSAVSVTRISSLPSLSVPSTSSPPLLLPSPPLPLPLPASLRRISSFPSAAFPPLSLRTSSPLTFPISSFTPISLLTRTT